MAETTNVIRIVIDARGAKAGSDQAIRHLAAIEGNSHSASAAMDRLERSMGGADRALAAMGGMLRGISGALAGLEFLKAADTVTRFGNSLRVAGIQGEALTGIQSRLFDMAAKNGLQVEALGQMYGRVAMTSKELGASQADMLKFVGGVTDALKVQGGSAESASGALLQLSQAMGAGVVRAEEFNSILEGALPIAQAAARGMDGMGGSVAKLRAEVVAGNVTSRAFFEGLLKGFDQTKVQADSAQRTMGSALGGVKTRWTELAGAMDQMSSSSPTIIGVLDAIATSLGKISQAARESRGSLLSFMGSVISPDFGPQKQALELGILQREARESRDRLDKITGTGLLANAARNREQAFLDARLGRIGQIESALNVARVGGKVLPALADDPDNIGLVIKPRPLPPITKTGAGGGDANRYDEALQDAQRGLAEARAFAEIAGQGADAVAKMEVRFRALKVSQDVFSKTANDNSAAAQALANSLEKTGLEALKLKNLGDFRGGTASLREQNELMEAELRLANALPEARAKELATLKVMQEVKAKGLEDNKQDIADRIAVAETNERLKLQGEEIRRANEMWTAPLKNALESIQSSTANWIESMLEGLEQGKFSMADFGKIGLSVLRRMAAEVISLAVMRPMLGSVVNGLSSVGIISPGMASSLGYGGAGGGGGLSLPGGSGLGNLFGGGGFFSQPLASLFSSRAPAGGYSSVGALLQSGNTGASAAAAGIGGLGGISIGSALGAIGGIGMGAYQLFNSKSTGQTLGGIGSMIGAGVSLIPGIGQIAGPLIMMASALLPSLFGEPNTRTHSSTNASLRYGGGNWYTTGGAWGANANSGESESALRGTTAGIDQVFGLLGGVKDASKVWGLNLNSWTAQGKNWSYTSRDTALVDPNGNTESWRMNMDDMMDTGAAQVAIRSILSGATGEITATMKTALEHMRAAAMGIKETAESIVFVEDVYDRLGKGALTVRAQFRELESKFGDMTETAKKLGLALEPIIAEQAKATERLGQDYIDNLIDPVAAQLRAWQDEKASILANVDYIARHTDVVVDMARINEALLRKEAALKDQLYSGAVSQLEDAIKRLTYGDLSNITGAGTLAGMRASFDATVAQARAGDMSAYQRVANEGLALTDASRGYYASSPEYEAIRREIATIMVELKAQTEEGKGSSAESASTQAAVITANSTMRLEAMFRESQDENRELKSQIAELVDVTKRLLSRSAA